MSRRTSGLALAAVLGLLAFRAGADGMPAPTRDDLVGAWRLVRIEVRGPQGTQSDPVYGAGSEGLLIYDRSGWFSVQIMGAPRPALEVPAARPQHPGGRDAAAKEAVLDSYYAYYGTWTFDPASSTVTHRAAGALYPAEQSATYVQRVELDGIHMTFTRAQAVASGTAIQAKVWERVRGP